MKKVFSLACLVCWAGALFAQERIPQEQALHAARLVSEQAAKIGDAQLKTDVDTDKPFGLKHGEVAALVLPEKKLSEEQLRKAGKNVIPVGQLWLKKLTPMVDGNATPPDKLRILTITADNQNHELPLLLLGVRKGKGEDLELVVYAKDKDPLVSLPLQPMSTQQELPLELVGKKGENDTATLVLSLLGKYQARLQVAAGQ